MSDPRERALRALRLSGRRLVHLAGDTWAVLAGRDRRMRPLMRLEGETVKEMIAAGEVVATEAGCWSLAPDFVAPTIQPAPRWIFTGTAVRRPGERMRGFGFIGLAREARVGAGKVTLRHTQAGLRLIADAELAASDVSLTMNWDAGPVDRNRRSGSSGGRTGSAFAAATTLRGLRRKLGEPDWRLLWALCVDGDSLAAIRSRFAVPQQAIKSEVARALERLAHAYGM